MPNLLIILKQRILDLGRSQILTKLILNNGYKWSTNAMIRTFHLTIRKEELISQHIRGNKKIKIPNQKQGFEYQTFN
jgi:hypothetical protein